MGHNLKPGIVRTVRTIINENDVLRNAYHRGFIILADELEQPLLDRVVADVESARGIHRSEDTAPCQPRT